MAGVHEAVIPVGKADAVEIEAASVRAAKLLRQPLELKGSLPVPSGSEDAERGQHRASKLMRAVHSMTPQLGPGKLVGIEGDAPEKVPLRVDGHIFVTDVDLYTVNRDGVFGALLTSKRLALVSIRRLRESFYRRPADANKQRARLVKEIARMGARLLGAKECTDPQCVLASSRMLADIDLKEEKFCRACSQRLFEGTIRI